MISYVTCIAQFLAYILFFEEYGLLLERISNASKLMIVVVILCSNFLFQNLIDKNSNIFILSYRLVKILMINILY
jgi:hypothetical protein